MSDFCMDGKNPICWLLAPFALLSGCKEDDAATGTDLDVDSDSDVDTDADADVDTYVGTYTPADSGLPVSFGRAQVATSKPNIISDFYRNPRLWNMRTLSTIAVASGMFLSGCGPSGPSDATIIEAIRNWPLRNYPSQHPSGQSIKYIYHLAYQYHSIELIKRGKMDDNGNFTVLAKVKLTKVEHCAGRLTRQECEGEWDYRITKKSDQYGDESWVASGKPSSDQCTKQQ